MIESEKILFEFFGYKKFRILQKEIVENVVSKNDTIALLPTGGGKSICFQVPGLILDGVCLVISPLIALMKDQVENLLAKNISAIAIFQGMSQNLIIEEFENCVKNKYKFLYVSPERLQSKLFIEYCHKINFSMIAIDEAHCISQWGFDFRPSYLKISEIYKCLKNIPKIALTATATPEVIKDIKDKLKLNNPTVYSKSFVRNNLTYRVLKTENKPQKLLNLCKKLEGTGLIYVNSRKKTFEISQFLNSNNVSADFYNAGIEAKERSNKQENWKTGKTRIMVCTNAFGMGIDKPDVRFVIHEYRPETIEAYYQEAGRAGRDENESVCILLYHTSDIQDEKLIVENKFPNAEFCENTYHLLCQYLQINYDIGEGIIKNFNFKKFHESQNLNPLMAHNALKILENEELISISDSVWLPSRLKIIVDNNTLNYYIENNELIDEIIKVLLRSYGGLFDYYTPINERELAFRINKTEIYVKEKLNDLHNKKIIDYLPNLGSETITFIKNRKKNIKIEDSKIVFLRNRYINKINSVYEYCNENKKCRSLILVNYFGEKNNNDCGKCDICINKIRENETNKSIQIYYNKVKELIVNQTINLNNIDELDIDFTKEKLKEILRWMKDNKEIDILGEKIIWKERE